MSPAATALAIAGRALIPVQARVNGELSGRLEDGLGAATLSFFGGLLILRHARSCLPDCAEAYGSW